MSPKVCSTSDGLVLRSLSLVFWADVLALDVLVILSYLETSDVSLYWLDPPIWDGHVPDGYGYSWFVLLF